MNKKEITNELRKTLEKIYDNLRERIDPKAWKNAIKEPYETAPEETSIHVIDFFQKHDYMPAASWRAVCDSISLRNNPVAMSDIYSEPVINALFEKMVKTEPIRYDYISADTTEEEIEHIMNLAEKTNGFLNRGQVYLASGSLEELKKLCPTHPDVLDMQKRFLEIKATGGVTSEEFRKPDPLKKYENRDQRDGAHESCKYYEDRIQNDYRDYGAYYPLGQLYLKNEEIQKADYLADLLLNFNKDTYNAKILKGRILEKEGKLPEALFYYKAAFVEKPGETAAAENASRILEMLEPGSGNALDILADVSAFRKSSERSVQKMHVSEKTLDLTDRVDELVRKGRMTEAYYELVKNGADLDPSDLFTYKKAYVIYSMRREPEARAILSGIENDSVLYERAGYLIEDIERNIVENKKFEDIEPADLVEIFFNTQMYKEALSVFEKIDISAMTAELWSLKGRCEIETSSLNTALQSFTNAVEADSFIKNIRGLTAMIYQVKGDYEKALVFFNEELAVEPENEEICEAKAALLYSLGRTEELLQFTDEAEAVFSKKLCLEGYAGLTILNHSESEDNEKRGLKYLENSIAAGSCRKEFYTAAIDEYIKNGMLIKAAFCAEKGITAAESPEDFYMKKAELLFLSGKSKYAEILAGTLLTKKPDSAEIQYLMGRINAQRNDSKNAVKWFRSAADIDSRNHKYAYALADKCFEMGDMNTALEYYTKAILIDGEDYISYKRRALIYEERDEDQKAISDINCAMRLKPDDAEVYLIIGNILSNYELEENTELGEVEITAEGGQGSEMSAEPSQKENEEGDSSEKIIDDMEKDSEYYYSKAIRIDSNYRQGYICRARFYADKGRLREASADIEQAIRLDSEQEDAYMIRGIIRHISGEHQAAIEDFERASKDELLRAQAYSYMAKCSNSLGEYENAALAAEKGIEADPDFLNLYVNRGVALYNLGRFNQAVEDFKRIILRKNAINTISVEVAYRFRGMSYDRLGRRDDALSDYRMLLRYNPDHTDIRQRLEEIENEIEAEKPKQRFSLFRRKKK